MPTNFLEATGGSTAGYFSAVVTLSSTELVSLGSSVTIAGTTVFTSSGNFGQSIWGEVAIKFGGAITPATGGFISGWFVRTPDGGTTFEQTTISASNTPMARPADFIIPLSSFAYANTNIAYGSGIVKMPWSPIKVFIQNNSGATFPSSATAYTSILLGPVAVQF
jgi:hypothetical protein